MSAAATGPAGPESQALTAERLAEIRAELTRTGTAADVAEGWDLEVYRDVKRCLRNGRLLAAEVERLLARVAALESERHTTNEALSDAAVRMRADRDRIAELEQRPSQADVAAWLTKKAREYPRAPERQESVPDYLARLASKVTRGAIRPAELRAVLAPSDAPCEGPQRHDYRLDRDLPETGGAE